VGNVAILHHAKGFSEGVQRSVGHAGTAKT